MPRGLGRACWRRRAGAGPPAHSQRLRRQLSQAHLLAPPTVRVVHGAPDPVRWDLLPSWATQLHAGRSVRVAATSRAGATAGLATSSLHTFTGQVGAWEWAGQPRAQRTVVYFGYNDVNRRLDLGAWAQAYAAAVDQLVAGGTQGGDARRVLVLVHDWGSWPAGRRGDHALIEVWNGHARAIAAARLRVGGRRGQGSTPSCANRPRSGSPTPSGQAKIPGTSTRTKVISASAGKRSSPGPSSRS